MELVDLVYDKEEKKRLNRVKSCSLLEKEKEKKKAECKVGAKKINRKN